MSPTAIVHAIIENAALAIELFATLLVVVTIAVATISYVSSLLRGAPDMRARYVAYKTRLGRALLLCLEILVAADIIRTVTLDTTLVAVLALGLLVVIRTFLSWSLILEVEGHWPWRSPAPPDTGT